MSDPWVPWCHCVSSKAPFVHPRECPHLQLYLICYPGNAASVQHYLPTKTASTACKLTHTRPIHLAKYPVNHCTCRSCRYSSLRTNLPRQIMSFSDFPFIPEVMGDKSHDPRRFPSHTEVQAWLEVFATRFELRKHIRFNSQIISLKPLSSPDSSIDHTRLPNLPAAVDSAPRWNLKIQTTALRQDKCCARHAPAADQRNQSQPAPFLSNDMHGPVVHTSSSSFTPSQAASEVQPVARDPTETPMSNPMAPNGCRQSPDSAQQHDLSHQYATTGPSKSTQQSDSRASQAQRHCQSDSDTAPHLDSHISCEFDAVLVCVGNYHQPNLPEVKGMDDFPGLQMHAHNYRRSSMFAGMRVIVVGASFSGINLLLLQQVNDCIGCTLFLHSVGCPYCVLLSAHCSVLGAHCSL